MIKSPIRIIIADDNRFFCEALKESLDKYSELRVLECFFNIEDLIAYSKRGGFDVVILDINFKGENSLDFIDDIRANQSFKIISLTTLNNEHMKSHALKKGVDGFIGKDSSLSKFKAAIIATHHSMSIENERIDFKNQSNNLVLTERKLEVLQALYNHADKKESEISTLLNITENSLKSHKRELFEITNTKNTPDLIRFGIKNGLIVF